MVRIDRKARTPAWSREAFIERPTIRKKKTGRYWRFATVGNSSGRSSLLLQIEAVSAAGRAASSARFKSFSGNSRGLHEICTWTHPAPRGGGREKCLHTAAGIRRPGRKSCTTRPAKVVTVKGCRARWGEPPFCRKIRGAQYAAIRWSCVLQSGRGPSRFPIDSALKSPKGTFLNTPDPERGITTLPGSLWRR